MATVGCVHLRIAFGAACTQSVPLVYELGPGAKLWLCAAIGRSLCATDGPLCKRPVGRPVLMNKTGNCLRLFVGQARKQTRAAAAATHGTSRAERTETTRWSCVAANS